MNFLYTHSLLAVGTYQEQDDERSRNAIFLKEKPSTIDKKGYRKQRKVKTKIKRPKVEPMSSDDEFNMDEFINMAAEDEEEEDPIKLSSVEVIIKTEFNEELEEDLFDAIDKNDDSEYEQSSSETDDDEDDEDFDTKPSSKKTHLKTRSKCTRSSSIKARSSIKAGSSIKSKSSTKRKKVKIELPESKLYRKKMKKMQKLKFTSCQDNCKLNCTDKIDHDQRRQLCSEFWKLNYEERKDYVLQWVERKSVCTIKPSRTRTTRFTSRYYLRGHDDERKRICVKFFLNTLSLDHTFVKATIESSDVTTYTKYTGKIKSTEEAKSERKEQTNEAVSNDCSASNKDEDDLVHTPETESALPQQSETSVEEKALPEVPPLPIKKKYKYPPKDKNNPKVHLPLPVKCDENNCQMKCHTHFSEEQRVQICASYWSMDFKRRKDFILSKVESRPLNSMVAPEYRKSNKAPRAFQNFYFLRGANGKNVRVCKPFFRATLCIGGFVIKDAITKIDRLTGMYDGDDKRRNAPNKTPEELAIDVKAHIESYPTWVPFKTSRTRYLHSALSIRRMYHQYKDKCDELQRRAAGADYFAKIFHTQYQLAFLKHICKHPYRPKRKKGEKPDDIQKPRKVNLNISEFTGEEPGGFWTPAPPTMGDVNPVVNPPRVKREQDMSSTNPVVHIQENLQLQSAYFADPPYMLPQLPQVRSGGAGVGIGGVEQLMPQLQQMPQQQAGDALTALPTYDYPGYLQHSAVFRML